MNITAAERPHVQQSVLAFAGSAAGVYREFHDGYPIRVEGDLSLWHWSAWRDGSLAATALELLPVGGRRRR